MHPEIKIDLTDIPDGEVKSVLGQFSPVIKRNGIGLFGDRTRYKWVRNQSEGSSYYSLFILIKKGDKRILHEQLEYWQALASRPQYEAELIEKLKYVDSLFPGKAEPTAD